MNYDKMYQSNTFENDSEEQFSVLDSTTKHEVEDNIEQTETEPLDDTVRIGFVSNCTKAYIRKAPSQSSDHLTVVDEGYELLVENSVEDWYKVTTQIGIEGYIMSHLVKFD